MISFTPGAEIYAESDAAGQLYHVAFGAVRIYRLLSDGRRQICAFHMAGEVFGFEAGRERHFFADAVTAVGRFAGFLLELADSQDVRGHGEIDLPMSRTNIADYLGLTIETVSRALTRLKSERIIRLISQRQIDVVRWDALERLAA